MSPFLFLLVIDWIMKVTTEQGRNVIEWTLWKQLDDLYFADDLALLSHAATHQMPEKTTTLAATLKSAGLNIHQRKTKIIRVKQPVAHQLQSKEKHWKR